MGPRTITNQMMINLNYQDIKDYKEKRYDGPIKKLVDVEFPDHLDVATEPPVDEDVNVAFDINDEIYPDYSNSSDESEEESDNDSAEEEEDD